jgi:hypothetical protein
MNSSDDICGEMNADTALSTPLLGILPDEEDGRVGCAISTMIYNHDECREDNGNEANLKDGCENCVMWMVSPLLLFLQFGMAFLLSSNRDAVADLRWSTVNFAILVFLVTAVLYQQAIRHYQLPSSCILLDLIMGLMLILFDRVVVAICFMLMSMLTLAIFVSVSSVRILVMQGDAPFTPLVDELEVSTEQAPPKVYITTVN